jgi:hypothetical protein
MPILTRTTAEKLRPGTRFSSSPEAWHSCPCYVVDHTSRRFVKRVREGADVFYLFARTGDIGSTVGSAVVWAEPDSSHPSHSRMPTAAEVSAANQHRKHNGTEITSV